MMILEQHKERVNEFVAFVLNRLGVKANVTVDYLYEDGVNGMCIDTDNEFLVLVKTENRNLTQVFCTIAHELVHVKQHILENLSDHLSKCDIPYFDRWWEIEAIEKSETLIKEYVNTLK